MKFIIDHTQALKLEDLRSFMADDHAEVELSAASQKVISDCRAWLDQKMKTNDGPIYGINTGFGSLCNVIVPDADLEQLQENLVKSHACGAGEEVPVQIVKLMLFLKIRSLSYGKSGVQLKTVQGLCDLINNQLYPVVYQQGSLGASGDLAPLAHLCLPLLGMGQVRMDGIKVETAFAYAKKNLSAIRLQSKEGLALLNGTQFMGAYGVYCLLQAQALSTAADVITALSIDAFDARIDPFKDHLHTIRPHAGQLQTARKITSVLNGSEIIARAKTQVQDPYSFRCVPQVHGASKDAIAYVTSVFETEINSVTDNPTVFPEENEILSGGNFHGQPLAITLDFLCIALAELASISERRTYLLISGQRGLPPFLSPEPGLNSGFMIPQYTAASIVSQSKQLCTPASVDSIVSSNGQEDHVSMGANAATKCFKVAENTTKVLSIELLNAAQAIEFRRPQKTSAELEELLLAYRKKVAFMRQDEILFHYMQASEQFVKDYFHV